MNSEKVQIRCSRGSLSHSMQENVPTPKRRKQRQPTLKGQNRKKTILSSAVLEHFKNYADVGDTNDPESYHFKDISLAYMELIAELYIKKETNYADKFFACKINRTRCLSVS